MAKRFTTQLFVSRLSGYTTDQSLRQLFSPFGQIREARLIRDSQTQRPKGFGFITFESEDDAQKAMKALDGKIVDGRLIFVVAAKDVEAPTTGMNTVTKLEDNPQSLQNKLRIFTVAIRKSECSFLSYGTHLSGCEHIQL